jgi:hypothetical protein
LPSLSADADFFRVFPADPAIAKLPHTGQTSYTQTYTPSGSTWTPGLDESEVFFAGLKHTETAESSWEVQIGKGEQLYSIRGLFGKSQAPFYQKMSALVTDRSYFPASRFNRKLRVVVGSSNSHHARND